jgi:hypothetical protein
MKNTKFKIINQDMNVTCHMQFVEKYFFLGTFHSFYYVYTKLIYFHNRLLMLVGEGFLITFIFTLIRVVIAFMCPPQSDKCI